MQLPRGIFRDIKRESGLHSLISHLAEVSLSGYCKIISAEIPILMVFRNGTIILAECGELKGPAALEQISRMGDIPVDVILHDLNETQLELALEFNPSCVLPSGVPIMKRADNAPLILIEGINPPQSREQGKGSMIPAEENARSQSPLSARPVPVRPKNPRQGSQSGTDDEGSILMRELEALDRLEIESMTEKFRANCRLMIEKLDLEHLLEQNTGKENHDYD
jgi:hypothetical protein